MKARVKRETIPKLYRFIAPVHDGLALVVERAARQFEIEIADIQDGQDVLEVAVGTGLSFEQVVNKNPNGTNVGVDITPAMLARARKRIDKTGIPGVQLFHGDAYQLPFPDESFDRVLNSYMFDLLPEGDFEHVLKEFFRVLRPGGVLVLVYMSPGETLSEKFWDGLYRLHPFILGGCRGVNVLPYVATSGFVNVQSKKITQLTFPSEVVAAHVPHR